jgi:hypothetical protein
LCVCHRLRCLQNILLTRYHVRSTLYYDVMTNRCLRLSDETIAAIREFCKRDRINFSNLCRLAIHEKLTRDTGVEERIGSSLAQIRLEVQTLTVMLDKLVFSFFTCVPEPEDIEAARAEAMKRRERYIQSVAITLAKNGDGHYSKTKGAS